uniref:Uncharacterized protein n=1 Tax=Oryza sativa subsp. japonica TaxID=39947 RepID=Q53K37_ORYSJ|nr:hypothetical protein [Oryza sativa Japonica Group]
MRMWIPQLELDGSWTDGCSRRHSSTKRFLVDLYEFAVVHVGVLIKFDDTIRTTKSFGLYASTSETAAADAKLQIYDYLKCYSTTQQSKYNVHHDKDR